MIRSSPSLLPCALAVAMLAPGAHAITTHATTPVGFMRYEVTQGLQTVGFPLMNEAAVRGHVAGLDATSLFVGDTSPVGPNLDPTLAYYLEFTAGPNGDTTFVGDRLEIDVARTTAASNPAQRIRLQLGSALSTLRVLPEGLLDYHFVIRAHVTLASVFGTGAAGSLQAGSDTETADQVYLLHNGVYQSYIFAAGATAAERRWIRFPEGNVADDLPIAPGMGVFVRHVDFRPATVVHMGHVRTHAFVQPLNSGNTLVSEPFPVENTFETRGMTALNGFTAGESAAVADSVSVWTGDSFRVHYFASDSSEGPAWRPAEATAFSAPLQQQTAFSPFRAVMVQKLKPDPDYLVPSAL